MRSIRKVSYLFSENLVDFCEASLNLHTHAWIFSRLSIASVDGKQHLSDYGVHEVGITVCGVQYVLGLRVRSGNSILLEFSTLKYLGLANLWVQNTSSVVRHMNWNSIIICSLVYYVKWDVDIYYITNISCVQQLVETVAPGG